jgi:transcriptional regulator of acetoin/glycerol metabolism
MQTQQQLHTQQVQTLARDNPQLAGSAAAPSVAGSWLRCLQQHNLDPAQNMLPSVIEPCTHAPAE